MGFTMAKLVTSKNRYIDVNFGDLTANAVGWMEYTGLQWNPFIKINPQLKIFPHIEMNAPKKA